MGMFGPWWRPNSSDPVTRGWIIPIKAFKLQYYIPMCLLLCIILWPHNLLWVSYEQTENILQFIFSEIMPFHHGTSSNKAITMQYKIQRISPINNKCKFLSIYNSSLSMYSSISNMFQHDIHHRNSLTIIQPFTFCFCYWLWQFLSITEYMHQL